MSEIDAFVAEVRRIIGDWRAHHAPYEPLTREQDRALLATMEALAISMTVIPLTETMLADKNPALVDFAPYLIPRLDRCGEIWDNYHKAFPTQFVSTSDGIAST